MLKFRPAIAGRLRRQCPSPSPRWHLDEMVVRVGGERLYLWWAVDDESEALDVLVQRRRNRATALKLMHRQLKRQAFAATRVTTERSRSFCVALTKFFKARPESG
jgi:transposase-like protein